MYLCMYIPKSHYTAACREEQYHKQHCLRLALMGKLMRERVLRTSSKKKLLTSNTVTIGYLLKNILNFCKINTEKIQVS